MKIRPLGIEEAEFIAHATAKKLMDFQNEPIPPFNTRAPGKLESCLQEPFVTFDGKYMHYSFARRAAVLFYLITKNHCFSNGNKRMAVMLTMAFCYVNKRWIAMHPLKLYDEALGVAMSKREEKDQVVEKLTQLFKDNMTSLKK